MVKHRNPKGVTVTLTVRLSGPQAGMLMFFAGRRTDPCGNAPTVRSLVSRKLIAQDGGSTRLQVTELGRRVVAQLDRAAR